MISLPKCIRKSAVHLYPTLTRDKSVKPSLSKSRAKALLPLTGVPNRGNCATDCDPFWALPILNGHKQKHVNSHVLSYYQERRGIDDCFGNFGSNVCMYNKYLYKIYIACGIRFIMIFYEKSAKDN